MIARATAAYADRVRRIPAMNTCTSSIFVESGPVESGALGALFMICEHHQGYRMGLGKGSPGGGLAARGANPHNHGGGAFDGQREFIVAHTAQGRPLAGPGSVIRNRGSAERGGREGGIAGFAI